MAAEINPVESAVDYKPWFNAVRSGDWCKAKEFLTLHPSAITATDSDGDTALHNAIYCGLEQIVEELVQLMTEEQLETKNNSGKTALTIAAAENIKIVECLVAKNKKLLGIANGLGRTPIVIAAKNDRWDIVEELVQLMTEEQLEIQDVDGRTALTIAAATNIKMVECLVAKNKKLLGIANGRGSTPILIAAKNDRWDIVEELVQLMTEEQLEIQDVDGQTALTIAAATNIKMVECLVAKNKKLLGIADGRRRTPIVIAAKNHRWDIVRYLYSVTPLEDLKPDKGPCGSELVIRCLQAKQFGIHVEHAPSISDARINVQNQENEQGDQGNSIVFGLLQGLQSRLAKSLGINHIRDLKLLHVRSLEILDSTCDMIKHLNNEEMMNLYETVFNAVENGIVEIVNSLCKARPELLVRKMTGYSPVKESLQELVGERFEEESIFHYAVECRQEKVYSLVYGAGKSDYLATLKNRRVVRMLYCAGMISPLAQEKLDSIAGAALQMQRERQWYKEVESMVTAPGATPFKEDGLKAARLFTKNHKELHKKGEKWMKDTASSYIIVSALITTIMFAVVFTVPGGNNQERGFPIFVNEKLFMVFVVSDAISLFSSVTSALMFLSILTSRYAEDDFLKSLPTKMIIGLSTLFISVATMMVAFSSAIFLMLRDKSWIITPIIFLAGVPVILFVCMQFPLLLEIFVSTYGGGIFDRKVKRWI